MTKAQRGMAMTAGVMLLMFSVLMVVEYKTGIYKTVSEKI